MVRRLAVRLVAGLAAVTRAVAAVLEAWSRKWDGPAAPTGGPPADWVERVRAKAPWLLEPPDEPLPPHDPPFEPRRLPPTPARTSPPARRRSRGETERRIAEAGRRGDPVAREEVGGPGRPGRASSIVPVVAKVRANLRSGAVAAKKVISVAREIAATASTPRTDEPSQVEARPRRAPAPSRLGPPDVRARAEHVPAPVTPPKPAPVATIGDAPRERRAVALPDVEEPRHRYATPRLASVPRRASVPETSWFDSPAPARAEAGPEPSTATFEVDTAWPDVPPPTGEAPAPMPSAEEESTAWPDLPAGLDDDDLVPLELVYDRDRGAALDAELRSL